MKGILPLAGGLTLLGAFVLSIKSYWPASSSYSSFHGIGVAAISDPWEQLERIIVRSLTGYRPDAPEGGRLWIESWHFGIRDAEMRADALRDNTAWRRLVAEVVRRGVKLGAFGSRTTRTRSPSSPSPPRTGWASRFRWPTRRSPRRAPRRTSWPRCATCSARTGLLDVGDRLDRGRLGQGF